MSSLLKVESPAPAPAQVLDDNPHDPTQGADKGPAGAGATENPLPLDPEPLQEPLSHPPTALTPTVNPVDTDDSTPNTDRSTIEPDSFDDEEDEDESGRSSIYDSESGYVTDDNMTNASRSVSSSILGHTFEDGIRYHKFHDGQYLFPNDENEQNRDDMKHAMTMALCNDRLHFAPLGGEGKGLQKVIDLGTGTGIWCIEMADLYTSAEVTGIDLSPIQPLWIPPNLRFVVDDIEDEWLYPPNHFDYVHMRHTLHSVRNPVKLIERAFQHTKPGGWVEFQELQYSPYCDDGTMESLPKPYAFRTFLELVREGVAALGSDLNGVTKLRDKMLDAGFTDVREERLKLPIGPWAKDKNLKIAGHFWRTSILDGLMNVAKRPLEKGLGWTMAEIEVLLVDVRQSLTYGGVHSYVPFYAVYGQKPFSSASSAP